MLDFIYILHSLLPRDDLEHDHPQMLSLSIKLPGVHKSIDLFKMQAWILYSAGS